MNEIQRKYKFTHIPIQYQQSREIDERFLEVKIYVLHTGENYNGSIFTKEAVNSAIPTLANTPLLAFVKRDENGKDFAGHEIDLVIEDGEFKWKYIGQAYGVIPEQNNARWEFMVGDDGVEREYLVVDAIVWKKFDDAVEIISRDLVKGQSMELSEKYSGYFNEDGLFVFENFKFDGCAILGNDVEPAMNSAKVEMKFSMDKLKMEIAKMMKEYANKYSKEVQQVNIEELLKSYDLTREQVIEAGVDIHAYSDSNIDEFKAELERIKKEAEQKDDQSNKESKVDNQNSDKDTKGDNDNSEYEKDEKKSEVDENEPKGQKEDPKDDEKTSKDDELDSKQSGDDKEFTNDSDEKDENELKEKYEELQKEFEKVVKERDELAKYKKNREKEDHKAKVEALISSFEKLNDSDVKEIREKIYHYTIDEIEEKLYAILGKKQVSEKTKKSTQFAKFYVTPNDSNDESKPSYHHLFEKHLKK